MKNLLCYIGLIVFIGCSQSSKINSTPTLTFLGSFEDDYGIEYKITAKQFIQEPRITYNIIEWNTTEQYIITQNAADNPSEANLFTRIDYVELKSMQPFTWGFCYTTYNAVSAKIARATAAADKSNPKKGCGGYPFSRMKKMD